MRCPINKTFYLTYLKIVFENLSSFLSNWCSVCLSFIYLFFSINWLWYHDCDWFCRRLGRTLITTGSKMRSSMQNDFSHIWDILASLFFYSWMKWRDIHKYLFFDSIGLKGSNEKFTLNSFADTFFQRRQKYNKSNKNNKITIGK